MLGFESFINEEFLVGKQAFRHPLPALEHIYKTHKRPENLVVTFTQIDKVGINPQSPFNTPIGIYFYPLKFVIKNKMNVPFAGNQPYINVCEFTSPNKILHMRPSKTQKGMERLSYIPKAILNTVKTTGWEYRSDYSQLWLTTMELSRQPSLSPPPSNNTPWMEKYKNPNKKNNFFAPPDEMTTESWTENLFFNEVKAKKNAEAPYDPNDPNDLYDPNTHHTPSIFQNAYMKKIDVNPKGMRRTSAALWNRYLRDADIDGFVDHDTGTIHPNEPIQGVVLLASAIKRIYVIPNKSERGGVKDKKIDPTRISLENLKKFLQINDQNTLTTVSIMSRLRDTLEKDNDAFERSFFKNPMEAAKFIIDNKPTIHAHDVRQLAHYVYLSDKPAVLDYILKRRDLDSDAYEIAIIMKAGIKKDADNWEYLQKNVWNKS